MAKTTIPAGGITDGTLTSAKLDQDGAFTFNEDSADADFRVETNGNANMLFISGGNDVVGIGAEGDLGVGLHVKSGDSSGTPIASADELVVEGSASSGITILSGNDDNGYLCFGDDGDADIGNINYQHDSNRMRFFVNAAERLRIASDGEISINDAHTDIGSTTAFKIKGGSGAPCCIVTHKATTGDNGMFHFKDGDNELNGSITSNGTNNTTAFNTSSDYRLKENETAITDGITRLKQLKPYRFNWKSNSSGDKVDGFFAHEVSSIVPEAIYGEKDAMTTDDDGKTIINPQQIDQSKLVPLLTAAIIELEARVKTLEDA
jgi:hypothetical protein